MIEIGLTWKPVPIVRIRGAAGLVAYQEFEVRDARGDTRYRSRTDPAPYFELSLVVEF